MNKIFNFIYLKRKNHIIIIRFFPRIIVIFALSLVLSSLILSSKNILEQIEKEIDKVEPYQNHFSFNDIKNDLEYLVNKYKYLPYF